MYICYVANTCYAFTSEKKVVAEQSVFTKRQTHVISYVRDTIGPIPYARCQCDISICYSEFYT